MPEYAEYESARQAVVDAQAEMSREPEDLALAIEELVEAEVRLRAAEEAVTAELDAAWQRNQQGVAESRKNVVTALRNQAKVETECAASARLREPRRPVLNAGEVFAIREARNATAVAREEHERMVLRFKAGVTAEQLADGVA